MSIISKTTTPLAMALLLLAGSQAFAAGHDAHQNKRRAELMGSNIKHQQTLASPSGDNSSPYIGLWLEGYPRSTTP